MGRLPRLDTEPHLYCINPQYPTIHLCRPWKACQTCYPAMLTRFGGAGTLAPQGFYLNRLPGAGFHHRRRLAGRGLGRGHGHGPWPGSGDPPASQPVPSGSGSGNTYRGRSSVAIQAVLFPGWVRVAMAPAASPATTAPRCPWCAAGAHRGRLVGRRDLDQGVLPSHVYPWRTSVDIP